MAARMARYSGGKHGALTAVLGPVLGLILASVLAFFGLVFAEGVAALAAGGILFLSYLFGGFVGGNLTGREASRDWFVTGSGWERPSTSCQFRRHDRPEYERSIRRMQPGSTGGQSLRSVVASYDSYAEAQRAVDHLSDEGFPVQRVSIVAEDLRFVEQITGRLGYGQATLQGAGSGAVIGAFFGFILGLFSLVNPLVSGLALAFYGLIIGAILGAILGLASHALTGGMRDFSSIGGMEAGRYNVMVDEEVAEEATRIIAGLR